jgi:hydrogenase nickel incorporation protein HypB
LPERTVDVRLDLRATRRREASAFRDRLAAQGTYIVRLLSSPGAGKTTLLQKTLQGWGSDRRAGVLVGDVETDRDAQRLAPYAPSIQITTGGACHLEIPLVERAFAKLDTQPPLEFLFIEDVGNLICPASHDLGEHLRVVALSVTEGDDKPGKYPKAFRTSHVVVFTKTDLTPYVPFSIADARADALRIQPELTFFATSALREQGIDVWRRFLERRRAETLLS